MANLSLIKETSEIQSLLKDLTAQPKTDAPQINVQQANMASTSQNFFRSINWKNSNNFKVKPNIVVSKENVNMGNAVDQFFSIVNWYNN